jgi:uncharacterized membrane protein
VEAKIYVKPLLGLLTLALAALAAASGTVGAQQAETFFLVPRWHQIVLEPGEMVVVPATAENRGTGPVEFIVSWEKTPGPAWETGIRGALTNFQVIAVAMPAGDTRSLSLEIKAPDEVEAGAYHLEIRAESTDGKWERVLPFTVTIEPQEETPQSLFPAGDMYLRPPRFSSLTGENDGVFEFSVGLINATEQPANLDLGVTAPQGWDIGFFPSFERDKRIISVSIDAGASATVTVVVTPASNADTGRYEVEFVASGGERDLTTDLFIELTGAREVRLKTPDDRLNANAAPGEPTEMIMIVANPGGAPLDFVNVFGQAPDGWELEFTPATFNFFEAGGEQEVKLKIQPTQDAIPGDYRLSVAAVAEGASDTVDIVITVTQSTIWGWVGLAAVLAVAVGMVGLFLRLGRR